MRDLIQWPTAKYWTAQWNPIIGCEPCSPACEHCYAAAWARRFGQSFEPHESSKVRPPRNCDRFGGDYKMLHTAWFDWTGSPSGQNPDGTAKMAFGEWLLAPAIKERRD